MTREEALQIIYDHCQHCDETEKALETLKENNGEWKEEFKGGRKLCSNCGVFNFSKYKNFCPNCGADMRGE